MKHNHKLLLMLTMTVTMLATLACGLADWVGTPTDEYAGQVAESVNATLTAVAKAAELPTPTITETQPALTEIPSTQGAITGDLFYPSEGIPPLRIVAFDVTDLKVYYLTETYSGRTYTLDVPSGTYYVLAYLLNQGGMVPEFAGAYSQFVLCGMDASCEDHSLVPVVVNPGETVAGIDLADWYLPMEQYGAWPSDPTQPETGAIRGKLGYPSEFIPPLRVVAIDIYSENYYYVDTQLNQMEYQLSGLPAGTYHVLAYVKDAEPDFAGAYSNFVTCGQTVDCTDHRLIAVDVLPGEVTEGVDPIDFYAQPGEWDWPEDPTR